ncbi:hypothetical protein CEV32_1242 [Brucella rhizosphaerae]|uniref:Uncharacterized protein n=1 Tax=Brucella rhizosphaerae TaxID=571254 RepID=A0A256FBM2_9HYPH|nr:hypothetical protein CEV32_1242 [Brucella rhizosphaerae]
MDYLLLSANLALHKLPKVIHKEPGICASTGLRVAEDVLKVAI